MTKEFFKEGSYWYSTNFKVGDEVVVVNDKYSNLRHHMRNNIPLKISRIKLATDRYRSTVSTYEEVTPGKYDNVYQQALSFEGIISGNGKFRACNFKLKENKMSDKFLIGNDRPCAVWQLEEVTDDAGVVTTNRIGDPMFFTNYTQAQAWARKAIQDKVRSDNVYLKYSILEEKSVAMATEPPVTFE